MLSFVIDSSHKQVPSSPNYLSLSSPRALAPIANLEKLPFPQHGAKANAPFFEASITTACLDGMASFPAFCGLYSDSATLSRSQKRVQLRLVASFRKGRLCDSWCTERSRMGDVRRRVERGGDRVANSPQVPERSGLSERGRTTETLPARLLVRPETGNPLRAIFSPTEGKEFANSRLNCMVVVLAEVAIG